MEHQFEKFSMLKHQDTTALPHTTPIPEKADTTCSACWGSGWETQFVTPCRECNGTGHNLPRDTSQKESDTTCSQQP
jgi:DnaJ-class molecular chaperone